MEHKKSELFGEVFISTKNSMFTKVIEKYYAKFMFIRSIEAADDIATLFDFVKEACSEKEKSFDNIFVEKRFFLLSENISDLVMHVVHFVYPIQRVFKTNKGILEMFTPEHVKKLFRRSLSGFHDVIKDEYDIIPEK